MIRLTGISKSFPGVKSLDKVDFSALAGEIHALVGENGAGKSTLVKIIGGVYQPDEGEVSLADKSIRWHAPREAQRAGIHVIYQELAMFPELSVAENVFIREQPRNRLGLVDHRAMARGAEDALARLGTRIDVRRRAGSLSVAEKQMVEIAKALTSDLKVLILDEPTAVIAGREVDLLFERLETLRAQGVSVVYISHRLEEIFQIADRVTVLKDGRLVGVRSTKEVTRPQLISMMVGRVLDDIYPPRRQSDATQAEILKVTSLSSAPRVRTASFVLRKGEVLGIGGMVGSGRTELAMAIFGGGRRDAGTVEVDGKILPPDSPKSAISAGIGFLTEDRKGEGLLMNLSVAENITGPNLREVSKGPLLNLAAERKAGQEEIKRFAIAAPSPDTQVSILSGGNQQKVLFARWVRLGGSALMLDEPTRGVDVGSKVEIYRIIRSLADQGLGIVMISSEMQELVGMCDRVLVMREGKISGELAGDQISEEAIMALAVGDRGNGVSLQ